MANPLAWVVRYFAAHRRLALAAGVLAGSFVMLAPSVSSAQTIIKNPGDHKKYSVELEPHGLLLWQSHYDYGWYDHAVGWGLGFRAAIPVTHNGFIPSINNSVAVGFGVDWGHYSYHCYYGWDRHAYPTYNNCKGDEFYFPVVMQWNFYITKFFSAFAEPGLAIYHTRFSYPKEWCNNLPGDPYCHSWTDTFITPVGFIGGRLGNETVSFTFRVGYPYLSLGGSFML